MNDPQNDKMLAMVIMPVSITTPAEEVLRHMSHIKSEAPSFATVQMWLLFDQKIADTPEASGWCKTLVEGGALVLLADEREHRRPKACLGRNGVAITSGLLEHAKDGAHITIVGDIDALTKKFATGLDTAYQEYVMRKMFGAVPPTSTSLPVLAPAEDAKHKPMVN